MGRLTGPLWTLILITTWVPEYPEVPYITYAPQLQVAAQQPKRLATKLEVRHATLIMWIAD